MYYTYSRHSSRIGAELALEDYYADGTVCDGEYPRVIHTREGWLVQFYDGSDGSMPALQYRV